MFKIVLVINQIIEYNKIIPAATNVYSSFPKNMHSNEKIAVIINKIVVVISIDFAFMNLFRSSFSACFCNFHFFEFLYFDIVE